MPRRTIVIDVLTPKQALLFGKVKEKLEMKGCKIFVTSRRYIELTNIFKFSRIKPVIIGRHGGKDLYEKLVSSIDRMLGLSRLMKKVAPDMVLSFGSPEAARVAFGLGIPHVSVNDSPHSTYVARLTIPLSCRLLTPRIVGKSVWLKYGILERDIVTYRSLDPVAWLKDFKPNRKILRKYGLTEGEYIVYRPEEYRASYLNVGHLTLEIVSKILCDDGSLADLKLVVVPRYETKIYKMFFKKQNLVILEHGEDTRSILFYSKGFIGAGGTMSIEAVLMGIPTASLYPSSTIIEEFLIRKGLLVKPIGQRGLRSWLKEIVSQEFEGDKRFSSLKRLKKMEDPAGKIAETCLKIL